MKLFSIIFSTIIVTLISACDSSSEQKQYSTPTSGEMTIYADETFKPVLDAEIAVFEALYTQAKVNVIYKSETDALNDLLKDSVEIIISTRPLSEKENKFMNNKTLFPKSVKIAYDAVALIVNKDNPISYITNHNFQSILTGEIKTWNELDANLKNEDVNLVFDNKNSSTVRYVLDAICKDKKLASQHMAVETNPQVIESVTKDINKIGVIGVSWISDMSDSTKLSFLNSVKVLAVSNQTTAEESNSYLPFQAYMYTKDYPFVREVYVINAEPRSGLATGFTSFLASDRGQRIILKSGILPATQPYRIVQVTDKF